MTDLTKQLLKLMTEGKTINEIVEETGFSSKQLFNIISTIENKGFEFNRKYYYNGDIIYIPNNSFFEEPKKGIDIITSPSDQTFEALVISDLHIGSIKERLDLLNEIYNYCAKEGIHIIINCGDLIDGMYGMFDRLHDNVNDQIDYAIKNYPFDKNILNFVTLGDHDYDSMKRYGQNFARVLESYRHDIVSLGYGIGQINIKNDNIFVRHPSDKFTELKLKSMNKFLSLNGHSHRMGLNTADNGTTINIPALSNMLYDSKEMIPSAVKMTLEFKNGFINKGSFTQLLFSDQIYEINEFECYLGYGKNITGTTSVALEEERVKKKILVPEKIEAKSQIEKFNARYGLK